MGLEYEKFILEVLSESNGLTVNEMEEKVLKKAKQLIPPERVDFIKLYTTVLNLLEKGILEKRGNRYYLK